MSWVGIGLAAVTAPTMPLLARAKRNVGHKLNSSATVSEASQNMICAYLSIALLVGLLANALLSWWWADPIAALAIGAVAAKEGIEESAWRNLRVLLDLAVVEVGTGHGGPRGPRYLAGPPSCELPHPADQRGVNRGTPSPGAPSGRDSGTSGLLGVEVSVAYGLVITTHTSPSRAARPRGLCPTGISASFDADPLIEQRHGRILAVRDP